MMAGVFEPLVGVAELAIVLDPVAVLVRRRRIDDAGDVARAGQDEGHFATEKGAAIDSIYVVENGRKLSGRSRLAETRYRLEEALGIGREEFAG